MRTLAVRSARSRAVHSGAMSFLIHGSDRDSALVSGICTLALALAVALTVCEGRADAQNATNGGGSGAPLLFGSVEHVSYASRGVRVDAVPELSQSAAVMVAEAPLVGASGGGLVINATFDSSITSNPSSAAIQATINHAVSVYQSLFSDPITVSILFRYATTLPTGAPLPSGALAESYTGGYVLPWDTYINALRADATTANDATANATLPASPLSTNINPSSAAGRAVGLGTPAVMFADGSLGIGGPYDGIVTLNSSFSFQFTRPPTTGVYDALEAAEHEMDEVLGFGSSINLESDLRPQDLFSWSAAGARNLTSNGSRYFSIDGGVTDIVGFNQDPGGDFGDWLSSPSGPCPQANPYVQDAFSCPGQVSDVTATSPEGINLDVVGYDLITTPPPPTNTPTPTPDDSGFVPPDANTLACEAAAAKNVAKLKTCIDTCHTKAATAAFNGKTFDEEACEKTDPKKSCRAKYDATAAKLLAKGTCPACLDAAHQSTLADQVEVDLDAGNGALYCAGAVPLGDDDLGFVPPDANILACAAAVVKNVGTLRNCVGTCHTKAATAAFNSKTFAEEACEKTDPKKSCRAKYGAKAAKLLAKGTCPACLDAAHQATLADQAETDLDAGNGGVYCAGSASLPP